MFTETEKNKIAQYYDIALNRIKEHHIDCLTEQSEPVFLISDTYPGVWLEHCYDSICLAKINSDYLPVAKNTLNLFLDNQTPEGQLPCYAIPNKFGFSQTQECVSFARLCMEYYEMTYDTQFLQKAYAGCSKWVNWCQKYRMPNNKGLIEMFGVYDTGHDHSGRWENIKYTGTCKNDDASCYPDDDEVLPIIAPDVNAVYYGNLKALADMSQVLGKESDKERWLDSANAVRKALFDICYDENDDFFYDIDKNGNKRKYLSIAITNLFTEHILDKDTVNRIYEKHLRNPKEFWTPFPFPSMAISDRSFNKTRSGNLWGYYSQALTVLRCSRWMDFYGKSADYDEILEKWVRQWTFGNDIMFGQELDPNSGTPSDCSQWYSSCMLVYIIAVKRLGLIA